MVDVFISYTGRGIVEHNWVKEFEKQLSDAYKRLNGTSISTWFYTGDFYGPSDDYRKEINEALADSLIFLPVMDSAYLASAETMQEFEDYKKYRTMQQVPAHVMKVIVEKSTNTSDIKQLGGATLIRSNFCDDDGKLFSFDSDSFKTEVDKLVKAIHKVKLEALYEKSLKELDKIDSKINIYMALGFGRSINANRDRLLKQLNETLKRADFTQNSTFQTLPDQLQLFDIDYDSIMAMTKYEDQKKDEWLERIIQKSNVVIVPVEFEDISGAEEFSNDILAQLNIIKKSASNRDDLKVFLLLNVPDTMYKLSKFEDAFDSAVINGKKNFTIVKKRDIAEFIDIVINSLSCSEKRDTQTMLNRFIYLIESNQAMFADSTNLTEPEKERRTAFRGRIIEKGYGLLPYIEPQKLEDAVKQHADNLALSSGVIIYKGTVEEKSWSINQQAEIFKVLFANNKLGISRAIYLDPDEKDRSVGSYGFFNYNVLLKFSDELDSFLQRIN